LGQARRLHFGAGLVAILTTGLQLVFDATAITVALAPFGAGDRIPDGLGAGLNHNPEHLPGRCLFRHDRRSFFSNSVLSANSAETLRSLYLSIHRSWIIRMGTAFRKCSFSRPERRVRTRPASSRTLRCFITPKRVMASPDSRSFSERPSR